MASQTVVKSSKVGIVGSGLIGRSWAMLFAAAGYHVTMFDIEPKQIEGALSNIQSQLDNLATAGLLKGTLPKEEQFSLISGTQDMAKCIKDAIYVQECVPENNDMKRGVFEKLDKLVTSSSTILASSVSYMPISTFTEGLTRRQQMIVAHPTNPPFYCPLVEVVPSQVTDSGITQRTLELMRELQLSPVLIKKEKFGFALNRIQCAILSEGWRLVEEGVISVEDIDKVMSDGLGMRYAFLGPFQVTHLNAPKGFFDYAERYGESLHSIGNEMGTSPSWKGEPVTRIGTELESLIPVNEIPTKIAWRDARVAALAKLKNDMNKTKE